MTIGCVLLAAGAGKRFGGNKLSAELNEKPIIEYILESLSTERYAQRVIVAPNHELLQKARLHGFDSVINDRPELGISRSIRLGLAQLTKVDACMFCVADQPLLARETINAMLDAYTQGTILALSVDNTLGNPVIFPSSLFPELSSLTGEESGKTVVSRHMDKLKHFSIGDRSQLLDIDTKENLHALSQLLSSGTQRER
jgi:molybdenum cofactor cytidylyltransferase